MKVEIKPREYASGIEMEATDGGMLICLLEMAADAGNEYAVIDLKTLYPIDDSEVDE